VKRKAKTVGWKRTYGQRHGLPGKRRGYKTVHSQQCISRTLKPGAVVVLEIPYVGLPGPPKPTWTHAVFSW